MPMQYFSTLIKPASSLCNLRCKYCFYADEAASRSVKSYGIMSAKTAENLIDRVFEHMTPPAQISFAFQGGEPTVAGLEYFKHFTAYAEEKNAGRFKIDYSIQTNGMVIDDGWCELFKKYHFLVGVSLDADKDVHDFCRVDANGNGTFTRVLAATKLLEKHGVDFNILSVITKQFARHPQAIFKAYVKNNLRYVQLIPCLAPLEGGVDAHSLTPRIYADFTKKFFLQWYNEICKGNYISVRQFDNLVMMLRGQRAEQCGLHGYCTAQFVVEANGGVYPCDFYVLDEYLCGNINENTIEQISQSSAIKAFVAHKEPRSPLCDSCKMFGMCGGGCRRYRSFYRSDPNYCPYQDFLEYAYPMLVQVARMLR